MRVASNTIITGRMSVAPLCVVPHPMLRAVAQPVGTFSDALKTLVDDLIETMDVHNGIGLAAPQIGQSLQVFVANPSRQRGRELVVVNPSLEVLRGRVEVTEGCLSLPKTWTRITRAERVRVTGQDPSGRPVDVETDGVLAVVLQHECDHLRGTLLIDRLPWYQRWRLRAARAVT